MWQRLPALFPNFPLRMLRLAPEALQKLKDTGWLREVAFRTQPRVNKLEIKEYLERVYGLEVERVNTLNYTGKKKAQFDVKGRVSYYRLSDWKKAYVTFKPPEDVLKAWRKDQWKEHEAAAKAAALQAQEARRLGLRRPRQLQGQADGGKRLKDAEGARRRQQRRRERRRQQQGQHQKES